MLLVIFAASLLLAAINSAIIYARTRRHVARDPTLAAGYRWLLCGLLAELTVPWLIAAGVVRLFDAPITLGVWVGAVTAWVLTGYWVVALGGAEFLVAHPGFLNYTPKNPLWIKVFAVAVPLFLATSWLVTFSRIVR